MVYFLDRPCHRLVSHLFFLYLPHFVLYNIFRFIPVRLDVCSLFLCCVQLAIDCSQFIFCILHVVYQEFVWRIFLTFSYSVAWLTG